MVFVLLYLFGSLFTASTAALAATMMRQRHDMSPAAMAVLTLSAGVLWPLLAVAAVQAGVLLGLGKGLGVLRWRISGSEEPATVPMRVDTALPVFA